MVPLPQAEGRLPSRRRLLQRFRRDGEARGGVPIHRDCCGWTGPPPTGSPTGPRAGLSCDPRTLPDCGVPSTPSDTPPHGPMCQTHFMWMPQALPWQELPRLLSGRCSIAASLSLNAALQPCPACLHEEQRSIRCCITSPGTVRRCRHHALRAD